MGAGPVLLPQLDEFERNWAVAEQGAARCMGVINGMTAELCEVLGELQRNEAWMGGGIRSLEHWATWKAGVAKHRAGNLTQIARRIDELPACFGLFREGRISEDMMSRIARKVPAT
ncbi:MAG: 13E12 repeat family protein, partial [Actinomycetota bacterium]|nr:13E12 repeat family protein [Actinomycetota bacterium]